MKAGLPVGLVSIPLKYMHTTVETVTMEDIENTAKLLAETVLAGMPAQEGGAV